MLKGASGGGWSIWVHVAELYCLPSTFGSELSQVTPRPGYKVHKILTPVSIVSYRIVGDRPSLTISLLAGFAR